MMLVSPLRALELPTFWPYTASVLIRPMEQDRSEPAPFLQQVVKDGPFNFNFQAYGNATDLMLERFSTSQTHTELFAIFGSMSQLRKLYLEPVDGMFPELDVLDQTVSLTLKPPSIPYRRSRRIRLRSLEYFVVTAKVAFCSAIMNQCQIPLGCAVEVNCTRCAIGSASDPMEDLLPRLRERIEAAARRREGEDHDSNEDELEETEQKLEIDREKICIANDTRGTTFICNTVTKLSVRHESGINLSYFLPPMLRVFGCPAKPRILGLHVGNAIGKPERYRNDLLTWLSSIDDILNEIRFDGDYAFQLFAPLLMAVSMDGNPICGRLFELSFSDCEFGAQTPNQATLFALLDMREGGEDPTDTDGAIERLLFNDCSGLRIDDFPEHLEIIVDNIENGDEYGNPSDDDEMLSNGNDEYDGNDSDATIQNGEYASDENEDDDMAVDES